MLRGPRDNAALASRGCVWRDGPPTWVASNLNVISVHVRPHPHPSAHTLRNRVGMEEDVKEYMLDDVGDFSSEAAASAFESVDKDKSGAMWTFISHSLTLPRTLPHPP